MELLVALGILLSDKIVMTAAHSVHDCPGPDYGDIIIKTELYPTNRIYRIHSIIIDSHNNPNLRDRGIDYAVFRVSLPRLKFSNQNKVELI